MSQEVQLIWRTLSNDVYGYYLWEVVSVVGRPLRFLNTYVEARDGSFYIVQCHHYWTSERANSELRVNDFEEFQQVEIIP